jgi:DNA-binding transcriptional LysR family regulator
VQQPLTINASHLRVLRALRERGTVTAAAAAVHLTPSAVSQQLRALSQSLGVPLTERNGRRVRLTPQALLVLRHAEEIAAQFERVQADLAAFRAGAAGRVAIASFASAIEPLVVPMLRQLAKERPQLEPTVVEAEPPDAFRSLDNGTLDILITVDYSDGPTHGDPRYHRVDLLRDPLVALLPKSHPLAGRQKVRVGELARDAWVMGNAGHPCVDVTIAAQATAGFTATVSHRANDWLAAAALVAGGLGIAFVPRLAMRNIATKRLSVAAIAPPIARNIYAAVRNGSENSPHIATVLDALRITAESLRER